MKTKDNIKNRISIELGVDISKGTRKRTIVEGRSLFFTAMRKIQPSITLTELAEYFNLNHASVIYSLRQYKMYEADNPKLESIKDYIYETYNVQQESPRQLREKIKELEKQIKARKEYNIIKKLDELLIECKGTKKENWLIDRLNNFYDINSKVKVL